MSKKDNNNDFTFKWIIENFDMCPHAANERLESPTFKVIHLGSRTLKVCLYPRGYKTDKHISSYVIDESAVLEPNLQIEGTLTVWTKVLNLRRTLTLPEKWLREPIKVAWGIADLECRENIFQQKKVYLPNNTLTLKYVLRIDGKASPSNSDFSFSSHNCKEGNEVASTISKQICATEDCKAWKTSKADFSSNELTIRTRIDVRKSTLFWPVKRFSLLPPDRRLTKPVYFGMDDKPLFYFTFFKQDLYCAVEIKKELTCNYQVFLKCKILITDASENRIFYETEKEHLFKASDEEEFKCYTLSLLSKLKEDNAEEVLYLRCQFASSKKGAENHINFTHVLASSYKDVDISANDFDSVGCELHRAYRNKKLCDVILRSEGQQYPAHKFILSARSRVFSTMFEIDMQEKTNGVVDITDINAETVDRMLNYLYSDHLKDLSPAAAVYLYKAADKYEILSLKSKCAAVLKKSLTVSSVCDIFFLSETHQDTDLLDFVKDFIHLHADEVFCSKEWEEWVRSNPQMAANMMLDVWRRKIYRI